MPNLLDDDWPVGAFARWDQAPGAPPTALAVQPVQLHLVVGLGLLSGLILLIAAGVTVAGNPWLSRHPLIVLGYSALFILAGTLRLRSLRKLAQNTATPLPKSARTAAGCLLIAAGLYVSLFGYYAWVLSPVRCG